MRLQFPCFKKAFVFLTIIAISLWSWTNAVALDGNETVNVQASKALIEVNSASALTGAISAVNANPNTEFVIHIRDNILMTSGTPAIRNTAGVTIMSDMSLAGAPFTITRSTSGRHFLIPGTLTLENIILDGSGTGGGVRIEDGVFYLNNGAVIQNCYTNSSASGGAISGGDKPGTTEKYSCAITIDGGIVRNNIAAGTNGGGGVMIQGVNSSFTMKRGTISGNTATSTSTGYGGGIVAYASGTVTIEGGTISGNTAAYSGGGVYCSTGAAFTMTDGIITGNKVLGTGSSGTYYGGGVHATTGAVNITGGTISNNTVAKGHGGGIGIYSTNAMSSAAINISGVTISGNTTSNYGGGVYVSLTNTVSTTVSVIDGIISDNAAANGGGVYVASSSAARAAVTVSDSVISGNRAYGSSDSSGGGIYGGTYSTISVYKSTISGNTASGNSTSYGGGGIYGNTNSSIAVDSSKISGNSAALTGGGIYGYNGGSIAVTGGSIVERNEAGRNGGGIYGTASCYINVADSRISGNRAPNGDGGGIYTADTSYAHIISSGSTVYSGNLAKSAHLFTVAPYPDIQSASVSIPGTYVLNNYDINYIGGPLIITYTVTYDANGADGTPPAGTSYPAGSVVTVAGPNTLSLTDYTFAGWNDDSGNHYAEGDTFTIDSDIVFYAQWNIISTGGINNNVPGNKISGVPNYPVIESNPEIIEIPEEMLPLAMNPVSPNPATGRSKHELFGIAGICLILSSIWLKINAIRKTKGRE